MVKLREKVLLRLRDRQMRAAMIYLGATVLARAGAIFLIPAYTRELEPEEYGDLALAQTLVSFLSTPMSLGLGASVVRQFYASENRADSEARAGAAARWMIVSALGSALLLSLGAALSPWPLTLGASHGVYCVLVGGALGALATIPVTYFRASQQPLRAAAFQLTEFCVTVGAGVVMVLGLGRGLIGAIEAMAASASIMGLVAIGFVLLRLPGRLDAGMLAPALRFGLPLVPHGAANQIQQMSDRWILKWAGLEAQLGTYALAGQLTTPVLMTVLAWHEAMSPAMGEARRSGGAAAVAAMLGRTIRGYALAAAAPGLAIVTCLPIAALFLGDRFHGSLWLVPLLATIYLVESIYYPLANVLFYLDKPNAIVRVTVSAGLLNVALNAVLILSIGLPGAFVARAISMSARTIAMGLSARTALQEATA